MHIYPTAGNFRRCIYRENAFRPFRRDFRGFYLRWINARRSEHHQSIATSCIQTWRLEETMKRRSKLGQQLLIISCGGHRVYKGIWTAAEGKNYRETVLSNRRGQRYWSRLRQLRSVIITYGSLVSCIVAGYNSFLQRAFREHTISRELFRSNGYLFLSLYARLRQHNDIIKSQ